MTLYILIQESETRNWKLCIKMQSISVFRNMAKFANFQLKKVDASKTQKECHVIHMFLNNL